MDRNEFITLVERRADVDRETAETLTAAALRTLAERLTGGEAKDLAAQLPKELKPYLADADEPPEPYGVEEFIRRVAERAGVDPDRAQTGPRAVFGTLRGAVSPGEFDDVVAQLPKEFRGLIGRVD